MFNFFGVRAEGNFKCIVMNIENNTIEITCPNCGGYGFIIDVIATCCGNLQNGSCCGVPDPEQYQKECKCNNGFVLVEEPKPEDYFDINKPSDEFNDKDIKGLDLYSSALMCYEDAKINGNRPIKNT